MFLERRNAQRRLCRGERVCKRRTSQRRGRVPEKSLWTQRGNEKGREASLKRTQGWQRGVSKQKEKGEG